MFAPRTEPIKYGEGPWAWDVDSVYQCTWYCFWRFFQVHGIYPTYQNRATKSGSYNNANTWPINYRDPVEFKGKDYTPVAGDIVIYDWSTYGHVVFMETDTMTSEYRNGDPNSFRFAKLGSFNGEILGYLHCPYDPINPVERNANVDQIQTTDTDLRIRLKPNLDADIVGHVQIGFYNVLDKKDATVEDKGKVDGLKCWYKLAKDRWCANVTTNYFAADEDDFMKEIERVWNQTKAKINSLEDENKEMKEDMKNISSITERWLNG